MWKVLLHLILRCHPLSCSYLSFSYIRSHLILLHNFNPTCFLQDKLKLYPATLRPNPVQDLDATVYAQIRALHFLKWNKSAPEALLKECGPCAHAYAMGVRTPMILPTHVKVSKKDNFIISLFSDFFILIPNFKFHFFLYFFCIFFLIFCFKFE